MCESGGVIEEKPNRDTEKKAEEGVLFSNQKLLFSATVRGLSGATQHPARM